MSNYKIKDRQLANEFYGEHNKPTAEDVGALPISGGTLTGNHVWLNDGDVQIYGDGNNVVLTSQVEKSASNMRQLALYNSNRMDLSRALYVKDVVDGTTNNYIIYGEHNKDNMPFLPLSGGTMSGYLGFGNGHGLLEGFSEHVALLSKADTTTSSANMRAILLRNSNTTDLVNALLLQEKDTNSVQTNYKLFGQHNKPTGTYTGNGSATARTINTGGIGRNFMVYCQETDSYAIFGTRGGIGKVGTTQKVFNGDMAYSNAEGSFVIKTTDTLFNQNGATYYYQVI